MIKFGLFLLLSVAIVDSGYAFIFGGGAWRRHYRKHRRGLLSCVEKQAVGPPELQKVRDAVDEHLLDFGGSHMVLENFTEWTEE